MNLIKKLIGAVPGVAVWACVATIIAQAIGIAFLLFTGGMSGEKLFQVVAVVHDVDLAAMDAERPWSAQDVDAEQPAFEELIQARLAKDLDFDFREQAVVKGLDELRNLRALLARDESRFEEVRTGFYSILTKMESEVTENDEVQRLLTEMKPKQAKEQLDLMIQDDAMTAVVAILETMAADKRKKILVEFKTPEDTQTLSTIIDEMRLRGAQMALVNETREQLDGAGTD